MLGALRREYRSLPPVYWVLFGGTLVNKAGGFVIPLLAFYLTGRRGLSEATAGLVVSCYGGGSMLAGFVGGVLSDRWGRRSTMLLSLFGGSLAMLALGLAHEPWALALFAALMGFLSEMYRPAVSAMIADVVPPADRARAFGHLYWAINLGFAIAPVAAGLLAHVSYLLLFVVDAATMAIYGVIVALRVPESRPEAPVRAPGAAPPGGIATVLADRTFMKFTALTFVFAVVMWQNGVALPLDMKAKGLSAAQYGTLIAINGIMIVFLQPPISRAIARRDRSAVFAWASILFGVGFGLNALVAAPLGYGIAIAIWTLGEIASMPVASAVVADLARPDLRGRYQGVYGMTWGLASFLSPVLGGAVLGRLGGEWLWGGCFVACALAAVGHLWLGPARERAILARRTEHAPATDT